MGTVVKRVNKIRARSLYRRDLKECCKIFEAESGEMIIHCDLRWLSRGHILQHFWQLKERVFEFLEEKIELPEYKFLLQNQI
jgi:hypothetical protein